MLTGRMAMRNNEVRFQRILGVRFCVGPEAQVVEKIVSSGGLVVVPAAPALRDLNRDAAYREALLNADFAITDSALMVWLWNLISGDKIPKLSGLKYLRALLNREDLRTCGASFWIMPSERSARRNLDWLQRSGVNLSASDTYVAPMYGETVEDTQLLAHIEESRPRHVVIGIGGGTQEKLGFYLRRNLSFTPSIHCIGAAIGFLSGDQVQIPVWADELGLGWLWRCISDPKRFIPRYWRARSLVSLMLRYREECPVVE